jgi:hypothetical protein
MMRTNKNKANRIATIPGVDALYYQLSVNMNDYIQFYTIESLNSTGRFTTLYAVFTRLSQDWTKQYTYFEMQDGQGRTVAKVGFKNLNTKDNLEPIVIQTDSYYMNVHGVEHTYFMIREQITELGLKVGASKIQRLDLNTYVYAYDFSYLEYYYFSTLIRSNSKYYSGAKDKLTTFYLGKRSNGSSPFMRIYDKWQELKDMDKDKEKTTLIKYKFQEEHGILITEEEELWNVEFELKRELLKSYGVNTVEDFLASANTLHGHIMKRIRLLKKKRIDGDAHTEKIQTATVWNKIEKEYNFMDSNVPLHKLVPIKYSKDIQWLLNRLREYKKEQSDTLTDNAILLLLSQELNQIAKEEREK